MKDTALLKQIEDFFYKRGGTFPEIKFRTNYHWSIFLGGIRLDIWPPNKRFHHVTNNERGGFENITELLGSVFNK